MGGGRSVVTLPLAITCAAGLVVTPAALGQAFPAGIELSSLDGGEGFVFNGIDFFDQTLSDVAIAGDVNGDGVDDVLIGAGSADPGGRNGAGETYVVFGRPGGGFPAAFELSDLDGSNGFVINGVSIGDSSGAAVAAAGDVNDDGFDDVIIGASNAGPGGRALAGASYVVFGGPGPFPAELELSTLDGSNGFVIEGIEPNDRSGEAVGCAGDVNGDGVDDVIIGASNASPDFVRTLAGQSFVVFGRSAGGFPVSFALSSLDGTNGFVINGAARGDNNGGAVGTAGDLNGDGVDDLVTTATGTSPGGRGNAGTSFVVFGRAGGGFAASFELSSVDGTNGVGFHGVEAGEFSGISAASAGDVNADGADDLVIGASGGSPGGRTFAGRTYVFFGGPGVYPSEFELSTLDGVNGFAVEGIDLGDVSGFAVSGAGDVNDDGADDVLIGAHQADPGGQNFAGEAYVVFGRTDGAFAATIPLSGLDGSDGFVLNGIDANDFAGRSVAGGGDINGDGIDDVMVAAGEADPGGRYGAGETYVVFGRAGTCRADIDGDGSLTIFDFLAFQNLFDAGNLGADFDGDGALTIFDFLAFQNEFDAGC